MSDKSYTIQVKPNAELAAIVDEILRADAVRIFLIVPDEARLVRHILNFKLLRREAEAGKKELIIVSAHPRVQGLATKAGLKVHQLTQEFITSGVTENDIEPALRQKRRVFDIMPSAGPTRHLKIKEESKMRKSKRSKVGKKKEALIRNIFKRPAAETPQEEPKVSSSYWEEKEGLRKKARGIIRLPSIRIGRFTILLLGGSAGIFVLGALFYFMLPSVEVTISPRTFSIDEVISITISSDVATPNISTRVLPGQIVADNETHSQQFTSTGREDIEERAIGNLRVFNEFSSAPQTLVATTRFISQDGYLFRTTKTVVIPGAKIEGGKIVASSTFVEVIAAEPGDDYNIEPSTFSIPGFSGTPKFTAFYAESEKTMEGGFRGVATVATGDDILEAENTLMDAVAGRAADKLRANIPKGYFLAPGALEEDASVIQIDVEPGQRKDTFSGSVSVEARAVLFRTQDIDAVIDYYFDNVYNLKEGTILLAERQISYEFQERDYVGGEFTINLVVSQEVAEDVNGQDIRESLVGKQEGEARSLLSQYPGIEKAHIRFWPFWVTEVPSNIEKVTVTVEY